MDEFSLLEKIELKTPGPRATQIIMLAGGDRGVPKSKLLVVDGMCCWCEKNKIVRKGGRYCSRDCNESALFNCYPQTPSAKAYILIKIQDCACAKCGESYEDEIRAKINAKWKYFNTKPSWATADWEPDNEPITYWQIGYNTGDRWHVDHILPIHKGGAGVGIYNIQVLCVPCHKWKTKDECSGRI